MIGREAVIKQPAYILAHTPNLLLYGASQRLEELESGFLRKLPDYLRDYETALAYYPHQVFIGNATPEELREVGKPWYKHSYKEAKKYGKYGVIISEDELYGLMKLVDAFDLIFLEEGFGKKVKKKLMGDSVLIKYGIQFEKLDRGEEVRDIEKMMRGGYALPLRIGGDIVGCVRAASKRDENQTAQLMIELLVSKATGVLSLAYALDRANVQPEEVDFLIECSEDIGGDTFNRGGGGIGKSIAEVLNCKNATGYDLKSFCSAPVFALVQACSLISSGLYDTVAVVAGGSVAKLGMNAKTHVRKGIPVLEDVLGGFGAILSKDDGVNPVIRPMGKQDIWASYHVKDMLQSLIVDPLKRDNLSIPDVDWYAPELQIPEILGRDIPLVNYRYIAEMAIRLKQIEESERETFIEQHGVPGFAPQQGHIPSGVPILGHARDRILSGKIRMAMVLGKGSLFLSRITKLHDGVSIMIKRNPKAVSDESSTAL